MTRLTSAPKGSARAQLAARADTLPIELKISDADELLARIKVAISEKQANSYINLIEAVLLRRWQPAPGQCVGRAKTCANQDAGRSNDRSSQQWQ